MAISAPGAKNWSRASQSPLAKSWRSSSEIKLLFSNRAGKAWSLAPKKKSTRRSRRWLKLALETVTWSSVVGTCLYLAALKPAFKISLKLLRLKSWSPKAKTYSSRRAHRVFQTCSGLVASWALIPTKFSFPSSKRFCARAWLVAKLWSTPALIRNW